MSCSPMFRRLPGRFGPAFVACALLLGISADPASARFLEDGPLVGAIADTQAKVVKIYGAGGFKGLEAYQSGFLISADGLVLTAWSYVLDTDAISVTLHDGRKFEAKLIGADPRLEVALLKLDATELPHFDLAQPVPAAPVGSRVLAFSNLFGVATGDEPVSVQHGSIAAKTILDARRGAFNTPYHGPVYVVDAMTNNPGAAGGALTNASGALLAMLGKELRSSLTNTWLNYAIPIKELTATVEAIRAGKHVAAEEPAENKPAEAFSVEHLGLVLVPDVLERTPPFVDAVQAESLAAQLGLKPDDLVLFVNDRLVQSCKALVEELSRIDRADPVKMTVIRGQQLIDVTFSLTSSPDREPQ
ncbi:MAG: trypsin-like peptidase domain-containing protein [Planctomycetaceae bacterium]|nr:trypsin-like peptidase domain-containing protein [Planctomycetaceae bacterium]